MREHLLKNLFGFEYLIAPYTIAHLKLSQYLRDHRHPLRGNERLQVFLTNCHTPLRCEVRKGNDTTPRACCPINGKNTDKSGIVGEVKNVCQNKPSLPLALATAEVYERLYPCAEYRLVGWVRR